MHPIPIYVAANGPLALRAVGEFGDGLMSVGNENPEVLASHLGRHRRRREARRPAAAEGLSHGRAHHGGRAAPRAKRPIRTAWSSNAARRSPPVLHFAYEIVKLTKNEAAIPHGFEGVWQEYCDYVEKMETPREKRYLQLHNGHCTFLMPEERRFVNEKTIRASMLVGEPDELVARIREAERGGLKEIGLMPPMAAARAVFKEFAEQVMRRY